MFAQIMHTMNVYLYFRGFDMDVYIIYLHEHGQKKSSHKLKL